MRLVYSQYNFESALQFGLADMIQFAGRTNKSSHFRRSIRDSSCFHHCPMIFSIFPKPVCERALFPKRDIMSEEISGHAIATDSSLLLCQLTRLLLLILLCHYGFCFFHCFRFFLGFCIFHLVFASSSIGFYLFCILLLPQILTVEFIIQPWVQNMKA